MSHVADTLIEAVEVRTFLLRMHCPNKKCDGLLEHDGGTRTENGIHGGPLEYRHICSKCRAGAWLRSEYPKVRYELEEEEEQAPAAPEPRLAVKKEAQPDVSNLPSTEEKAAVRLSPDA